MYEYKCSGCGEIFELIQKFSDTPLTIHEKCGGPVERLISRSSLKFKGTGWYVTDYAAGSGNGKKSGGKEGTESKTETKKEGSSASTESGSKSETKSTSTPSTSDKKV
jgi:putative FmdB family regulatory protein